MEKQRYIEVIIYMHPRLEVVTIKRKASPRIKPKRIDPHRVPSSALKRGRAR